MKKLLLGIIPVIMLAVGCAGSAKPVENPTANSGLLTLDQAINEAANRIDERIARGSKIAPLNFNSPHDRFSNYVLEELTANLVDSRILTVVDRREIDLIRNEFDFQFSGEVGDDSMQQMGQMLGAQAIISGTFTDMGGFYRIMIRVLNVQNATVEVQYRANIASDTITTALLTGGRTGGTAVVSQRSGGGTTPAVQATQVQVEQAVQTPAAPAPVITYNIGDRGPAGGWVFHDKGVFSNGWRYLEAAPNDIGPAQWGALGTEVGGTNTAVGTGRANTQRIVPVLSRTSEDGAALLCSSLNINGYTDWFLPSKDELNLLYVNLKVNGLGGFGNILYWSSSENTGSGSVYPARNHVWTQDFSNGSQHTALVGTKNRTYSIRAIRQF